MCIRDRTRHQDKPLIDLNGKTLIQRVLVNSLEVNKNSFVATDSLRIKENIEKVLLKKIVKDYQNIDLHHNSLQDILQSDVFLKALPSSFGGDPFSHPICIEHCNKATGKYALEGLSRVNTDRQFS